jgi:hypothetical protein
MAPMAPFTDPFYPSVSLPSSPSNPYPYSLQCTSRPSLLRLVSHRSHLDARSSNLSNATTASTKTFVTALALNGIIAGVEIVAFTVVWRYFRLIYEPRSLSFFESCACTFVLQCLVLTFVQKETAGTLLSPLGMAYICLQGGLS